MARPKKVIEEPVVQDQSEEEVMKIMTMWLKGEAANTAFMVKAHPMGKKAMDVFADKVINMLRDFVSGKGLPHVNTPEDIRNQIEKTYTNFWSSRGTKKKREASVA